MSAQYYFNVATGEVQEVSDRGQAKDLMGPYDTRAEAADALAAARRRTEDNDAQDRAEDDW